MRRAAPSAETRSEFSCSATDCGVGSAREPEWPNSPEPICVSWSTCSVSVSCSVMTMLPSSFVALWVSASEGLWFSGCPLPCCAWLGTSIARWSGVRGGGCRRGDGDEAVDSLPLGLPGGGVAHVGVQGHAVEGHLQAAVRPLHGPQVARHIGRRGRQLPGRGQQRRPDRGAAPSTCDRSVRLAGEVV